jgi:hypothetical protein
MKGKRQMRELAEQTMMDVVLLDSVAVFAGLVYIAIRLASRHSSRQNSN